MPSLDQHFAAWRSQTKYVFHHGRPQRPSLHAEAIPPEASAKSASEAPLLRLSQRLKLGVWCGRPLQDASDEHPHLPAASAAVDPGHAARRGLAAEPGGIGRAMGRRARSCARRQLAGRQGRRRVPGVARYRPGARGHGGCRIMAWAALRRMWWAMIAIAVGGRWTPPDLPCGRPGEIGAGPLRRPQPPGGPLLLGPRAVENELRDERPVFPGRGSAAPGPAC